MPTARPTSTSRPPIASISPSTLPARRAERHADAELVGAPRDVERQHAVDAGRRERQAERGEGGEQRHREARLHDFLAEHFAERDRPAERLLGVHLAHLRADRIQQQVRIAGGPHRERCAAAAPAIEYGSDHDRRAARSAGRRSGCRRSTPMIVTSAPRLVSIEHARRRTARARRAAPARRSDPRPPATASPPPR